MHDLLVIGAGLAGLSAALSAAKAGLRVQIIAKGMGVTHWHAGTLDVLGYVVGDEQPVGQPFAHFDTLPEQHPLRRLGSVRVIDFLNEFVENVHSAGLIYTAAQVDVAVSQAQNMLLPSPVGALRPTLFAPQSQIHGSRTDTSPMLIVGFQGMRDFYPHLIAENLCKQGIIARSELLPLELIAARPANNPVHLAEALDLPARRHHLGAALKKLVKSGERVGLPAILGMEQHTLTYTELQTQIGASIFEIPTLPPSVPGIRLYRALRSELQKLGVRIESNMEAIGFQVEGNRIKAVETTTSARPMKHRAGAYLLATGGLLGGGFNSDHTGKAWEVVFGLPLTIPKDRRQWFQPRFFDAQGHPVFSGGIEVNQRWQPVDSAGAAQFDNLWAAGGVLAHADPIRERSLEGIAIATGMAAAQVIADH